MARYSPRVLCICMYGGGRSDVFIVLLQIFESKLRCVAQTCCIAAPDPRAGGFVGVWFRMFSGYLTDEDFSVAWRQSMPIKLLCLRYFLEVAAVWTMCCTDLFPTPIVSA